MRKTLLVMVALGLLATPIASAHHEPGHSGTDRTCLTTGWNGTPYAIIDHHACIEEVQDTVQVIRSMFGL